MSPAETLQTPWKQEFITNFIFCICSSFWLGKKNKKNKPCLSKCLVSGCIVLCKFHRSRTLQGQQKVVYEFVNPIFSPSSAEAWGSFIKLSTHYKPEQMCWARTTFPNSSSCFLEISLKLRVTMPKAKSWHRLNERFRVPFQYTWLFYAVAPYPPTLSAPVLSEYNLSIVPFPAWLSKPQPIHTRYSYTMHFYNTTFGP